MKTEQRKNLKGLSARIVAILSALTLVVSFLLFSTPASAERKEFSDVPANFRAYAEIHYLTEKGIITGYNDGKFGVNDSITRLQAITMILREKGITDFSNVKDPGLTDAKPGKYGYERIAKAVELGILQGKTDSNGQKYFDASGKLTRGQMASILTNAYKLQGSTNVVFADVPKSHWAYNAVQALAKNQITTGYGNGKFGVNDSITRTQFAVMMARMLNEKFATAPKNPTSDKVTNPEQTPTKPTTENKYADGWVEPVLKSTLSEDKAKNFETLKTELGFTLGGSVYGIKGFESAINVLETSAKSKYEVEIILFMWDDDMNGKLTEAYRVPIVAKKVFELYFGDDAMKVWNYFNDGNLPTSFTANGRTVDVSYEFGGTVLDIVRK